MKKTALLSLFIVCFSAYSAAASIIQSIQLGAVNGRVINEQMIEIKKTLTDPVLFSAKQSELSNKLTQLNIRNGKIIKESEGNLLIEIKDEAQKVQTRLTIELWVDGGKIQANGKAVGSEVSISVPDNVKLVELRTHRPIVIFVPRSYRGDFKFVLDIAGWSA